MAILRGRTRRIVLALSAAVVFGSAAGCAKGHGESPEVAKSNIGPIPPGGVPGPPAAYRPPASQKTPGSPVAGG